jgi:O-succinylbenzoate synthase
MKKAAIGFDGVLAFVREIQPRRIRLLGIGYETRRARGLVELLLSADPELLVSMDSNRIHAVTGKDRKMTARETQMRSEEPTSVYAEVESEALQLAGVTLD